MNEREKRIIAPDAEELTYSGRIEWREGEPTFIYPCTSVMIHFYGTGCSMEASILHQFWNIYMGVVIDGTPHKLQLKEGRQRVTLAEGLQEGEHTVLFYKLMDSCNQITIHSFLLDKGATLLPKVPLPTRRIEVYGDSVSVGEVTEAVEYIGKTDPEHQGQYTNSYYAYAWMTARKLNAQIHNISQGGIALLDGTGYFNGPDYPGMESVYDKTLYNSCFGEVTEWNFEEYTPHVVIVAIGQNDSHPEDYMKEDYESEKAKNWRAHYKKLIQDIRSHYKDALIILQTTTLWHDASWDRAIGQVAEELQDDKVVQFLYSKNGCGTPGHLRIPEAEQMAEELVSFIEKFGEEIWQDYSDKGILNSI